MSSIENLKREFEAYGSVSDLTLKEAEQTLSNEEYQHYNLMVMTSTKSNIVIWLLWFFLGTIQMHMVYLELFDRDHKSVWRIIGLATAIFGVGVIILIVLWIYDAIKMNEYMHQVMNRNKASSLLLLYGPR